MNTVALDATRLAESTLGDPQFSIPRQPAISPGVMAEFLPSGFIVDGVVSRRLLRGASVSEVLPDLLPLLDGSRDWDAIAAQSGLDTAKVREVLSVLFSAGLLQQGQPNQNPDDVDLYLHRSLDATRRHQSGSDAAEALRRASVHVSGDNEMARSVAEQLNRVGVMTSDSRDFDLAVLVVDGSNADESNRLARAARVQRRIVLTVVVADSFISVGPLTSPDFGPCAECIQVEFRPNRTRMVGLLEQIVPSLIAVEVVNLLARVGVTRTVRNAVIFQSDPIRDRPVFVGARPNCEICGVVDRATGERVEGDGPIPLALAYEQSVAFPPSHLTNPRDHQMHFEPENIGLQFEVRTFPHLGNVQLETPANRDGERGGELDLSSLAAILNLGFGFKREEDGTLGRARRWAPSGGNLGSPQAYLAIQNLPGIASGLYAYAASVNQLAFLSDDVEAMWASSRPRVDLVVVGEFGRVWKKYGTFAYRVIGLDTGVALANVALAATHFGLEVVNNSFWNEERLNNSFQLEAATQIVSAHLTIRSQP